ncbi:MAG: hypothetical protein H6581_30800 [Bacteroidia bacterium]|nr:hypothetical protein [Bacteroidia bacterium]
MQKVKAWILFIAVIFTLAVNFSVPVAIFIAQRQACRLVSRSASNRNVQVLDMDLNQYLYLRFERSPKGHMEFFWQNYKYDIFETCHIDNGKRVLITCKKDKLETLALRVMDRFRELDQEGQSHNTLAQGFFAFYFTGSGLGLLPVFDSTDLKISQYTSEIYISPLAEVPVPPPQALS